MRQIAARLGRPAPILGRAALDEMAAYPWPGNVRELRNVIERALILSPGPALDSIGLGRGAPLAAWPDAGAAPSPSGPAPSGQGPGGELNLRDALGHHEKQVVLEALRRSGGVRKEAARLLGIDQRNLGYYVRKHGIDPDRPDGEFP